MRPYATCAEFVKVWLNCCVHQPGGSHIRGRGVSRRLDCRLLTHAPPLSLSAGNESMMRGFPSASPRSAATLASGVRRRSSASRARSRACSTEPAPNNGRSRRPASLAVRGGRGPAPRAPVDRAELPGGSQVPARSPRSSRHARHRLPATRLPVGRHVTLLLP
jgi:hypothetical protein